MAASRGTRKPRHCVALDKSRDMVDAAGWVPGADGVREKNGQSLSFSVTFSAVFAGNQAILGDAQRLIFDNGLLIPTIELSQAIGVGPKVHDFDFEASARLQFYDTWLG